MEPRRRNLVEQMIDKARSRNEIQQSMINMRYSGIDGSSMVSPSGIIEGGNV